MAEDKGSPSRLAFHSPITNGNSTPSRTDGSSPFRSRPLGRASTLADLSTESPDRRRSSMLSDSVGDARQSLKSATDDLLLPTADKLGQEISHEVTHWHSVPLAFALLPAVGGLFIKDGSAIITDLTLLGLAAVFLNWSVRLPWDWYCSAQAVTVRDPYPNDVILEESSDEEQVDNANSPTSDTLQTDHPSTPEPTTQQKNTAHHQSEATQELRTHELFALLACFLSPLIAAYLLHTIRFQLSRPSEGLVSDFNLTIFLLAAEIRPLSHLVKMIQKRTLYLQNIVNKNPYTEPIPQTPNTLDLTHRLDELEAHIAEKSSQPPPPPTSSSNISEKKTAIQVTTEVRRTLQPDLDALNRAVRRYEKKATLQTMQTESRLQDLETRLADALSLAAAAAAQSSQRQRPSFVSVLISWISTVIILPLRGIKIIISLPSKLAGRVLDMVTRSLSGKIGRELKTAGRVAGSKRGGMERNYGRKDVGGKKR
ncbi:MAG: hypothetical protein M1812_003745 [Candelaria pacifica]|nr:MAG: hypothetical protein M1812_003745 [Candelaria pacifica]